MNRRNFIKGLLASAMTVPLTRVSMAEDIKEREIDKNRKHLFNEARNRTFIYKYTIGKL